MNVRPLPRYTTSAVAAALITGSLLLLMQSMIATGRDPIVRALELVIPPLLPERTPTAARTRRLPEKIDPPAPAPARAQLTGDGAPTTGFTAPPVAPSHGAIVPEGNGTLTGGPVALVKVAAAYPPRAIERGLEGHVIVEYTVTRMGTVRDVRVVESSHVIFETHAIRAAAQFRYRPRVVAGNTVDTPGVLNKFTFVLEN